MTQTPSLPQAGNDVRVQEAVPAPSQSFLLCAKVLQGALAALHASEGSVHKKKVLE